MRASKGFIVKSELDILLEEWARRHRVAGLACDEFGNYSLLFDGQYEVRLTQPDRLIVIETELDKVPSDRATAGAVLDELMSLQLADCRDAAEVLALNNDTEHLILFRQLQADRTNAECLAEALSSFVNAQEFFSRRLKTLLAPALTPFMPMAVVHA